MGTTSAVSRPDQLAPGTLVGGWRVVEWAGRGAHGVVYRAVPAEVDEEFAQARSVALKLALRPWDPRFEREAELLSRVRHPSIPRLWDQGKWGPEGVAPHPFLVLDWVDGEPLYEWAQLHSVTSQQVLGVLGQVASALAALHAQEGVHRDVKGENVRVRRSDGRAMLLDLGTGLYEGAATLTPPGAFPGTPAYQSPEAALCSLRAVRDGGTRYCAGPLDDVYSLGVTAFRLVTGQYPELGEPTKDAAGNWTLKERPGTEVQRLNPRADSRLSQCIEGMLSVTPEKRGSAAQWAMQLAQAASSPGSENASLGPPKQRVLRPWWAVAAAAVVALGTWAAVINYSQFSRDPQGQSSQQDGDTAGMAEAVTAASMRQAPEPADPKGLADDPLPEPVPGQIQPNAKGQCPYAGQVVLNGACWVKFSIEKAQCEGVGGVLFKKACYLPFALRQRPPTSNPPNEK